jgi:ABC-type transport system involved in multi-copper enzyme maturation permease subunit
MSAGALAPPRAGARAGHAGFGQLIRSEWTKFRTVRGWVIGMFVAAVLMVFLGVFAAGNANIGCQINGGPPRSGKACLPYIPHGPGGEVVTDSFNFAHQPLTGNGTITARVISLSGKHVNLNGGPVQVGPGGPNLVPGLMPWSKAGIIIKQSLHQGSAYAAMLVTGSNGVRMQYNYTGDTAGLPGNVSAANPRWLRLTRSGDTITGYDSADGTHWTKAGTIQLAGLPATVQVGMFATSPGYVVTNRSFGGDSNNGGPSQATGVFDHVSVSGTPPGRPWAVAAVGGGGPVGPLRGNGGSPGSRPAGFTATGGTYTLTGSGDIAPEVPGEAGTLPSVTIEQSLVGAFIALIAIVVVAAMFFTAEYRRGLIRTTLAASPQRGPVLAAKAVVIGAVAFVTGLVAATVAIAIGVPLERNKGQVVLAVSGLTEFRVVVGMAAVLALAAMFATALGALLRRSAAAIAAAVITVVLPFLLVALNVLPNAVGAWVMRLTPTAGLAIQQSIPSYHQVTNAVEPARGTYPLPPFAGLGVLCLWTVAALALAFFALRRRDA